VEQDELFIVYTLSLFLQIVPWLHFFHCPEEEISE